MATTKRDYSQLVVDAARSVLVELAHLLGEYKDDIVLIGGWVPELLLSTTDAPHTGSVDVDIALNHRSLQEPRYKTLLELLIRRGYRQSEKQPFIFYRTVNVADQEVIVQIDFLAGEYEGTGTSHRTQLFEDMRVRKARGCDLAFEMNTEISVEGTLPEGGKDKATIRVAGIVPFIVMKGMALEDRLKEKDAWDVYYCIRNYTGGSKALAEEFRPHLENDLVREGLWKIAEKFSSPEHIGPKFVADFEEITDPEERAFRQRDAFERVNQILEILGVIS